MFFFFFNDTATTEIYTLSLHDALPIFSLDGARDAGAHGERRARGVDDRANLPVGDVAALDRDGRVADLELHGLAPPRWRAVAASHDRSISFCGTAPTDLPCAMRSASIAAKRRRNFSIASWSAPSASMAESRATFTSENSTSPSSSCTRAASPDASAAVASRISSSTLAQADRASGQSKCTRAALAWTRSARNSDGSDRGTPSIAERRWPVRSASRRLIASHCARASLGVATDAPPRSEERRVGKEGRSRWSPY